MKKINSHVERCISRLEDCGKVDNSFLPNYDFKNFINEEHSLYANCECEGVCIKNDITGWLQQADALKLYELAYFSETDILEIGCHAGLSTSIMAKALKSSQKKNTIHTIDLIEENIHKTRENLLKLGLLNNVVLHVGDAIACMQELHKQKKEFSFVFIDHAHSYYPVYESNFMLDKLLKPGGLALFHDYNDNNNTTMKSKDNFCPEYGVFCAVQDTLVKWNWPFIGVYGCTALYQKPFIK